VGGVNIRMSLRSNSGNATAHACVLDQAILVGYDAARAYLDTKIPHQFEQIYRSERKRLLQPVETAVDMPFQQFIDGH